MKKMMLVILATGVILTLCLSLGYAGTWRIHEIRYDGRNCIGIRYGSDEDDSRDRGGMIVNIQRQNTQTGEWHEWKNIRIDLNGLQRRDNYYKEICGVSIARGAMRVRVQVHHGGRIDDSMEEVFKP